MGSEFGSLRFMIERRIVRQRLELAKSEAQLAALILVADDERAKSKQVDLVDKTKR